jgi:mannan endo-1,4-beta-mannosidase
MKTKLFLLLSLFSILQYVHGQTSITYSINTSLERANISPYIYGVNANSSTNLWSRLRTENVGSRRLGGNRLSAFNWENNYSNAGTDYGPNSNDTYLHQLLTGVSSTSTTTGKVLKTFHDTSIVVGAYSLITVPMIGYVSKSITGNIGTNAPSSDWNTFQYVKGSAFTLAPSNTDGIVYGDEMVNWIVNQYGNASTANGIKGYSLDNEPDLWNSTHPRLHSAAVTCSELITKSTQLATAIKNVDPNAEVFGYASYGFDGYTSLQGASDWGAGAYSSYSWFIDAYLDKMKAASTVAGKRLIDVLDIHYYSEHQGTNGVRVYGDGDPAEYAAATNTARIQAPRSLWDASFVENSWIPASNGGAIQLLPVINAKIASGWPGTKLGVSEWTFSGDDQISGGLAVADALGIYGKYGVYQTQYWGDVRNFSSAAYKLYRNYDGVKSTFGSIHVKAEPAAAADWAKTSIYASVNNASNSQLNIVVLNKQNATTINATFAITSSTTYNSAKIYGFTSGSSTLSLIATIATITGNSFTRTLPALSAYHIILDGTTLPIELISFKGSLKKNREALLEWETASEKNISVYEIARSTDAVFWETIGKIKASNKINNYEKYNLTDFNCPENISAPIYYRLRSLTLSGEIDMESIIELSVVDREEIKLTVFPNPFEEEINLEVAGSKQPDYEVKVYNIIGELVLSERNNHPEKTLSFGSQLKPGIYMVHFSDGKISKTIRIIKSGNAKAE